MATLTEKRKAAHNSTDEIVQGVVIANYGDPGGPGGEDYHFDILSRYLVCMIQPIDRVLTVEKNSTMLCICQRPKQLWIDVVGGVTNNPTTQQRSDFYGNVSVGPAANFSTNGIPPINSSYQFGEVIKMRKLPNPITYTAPIFQSQFLTMDSSNMSYGSWHNGGSTLPYIVNNGYGPFLQYKTIVPSSVGPGFYSFILWKPQYEAMILNANISNPSITAGLTSIFNGSFNGPAQIFSANGGYLFNALQSQSLFSVQYEDINSNGKERTATSSCLPLVITTPSAWPVPSSRSPNLISYSPTYQNIQIN